jgi:hypothetical protein
MATLNKDKIFNLISYDPNSGAFYRNKNGAKADTKMSIGYKRVRITINGKKHEILAHRLAWFFMTGFWPKGEIDHIDGDRSNNSALNLRDVTRDENAKNIKLRSDNTSGVMGIRRHQSGWKASVGKRYVGYSGCFMKALRMRVVAQQESGYHINHGRHS